MRSYKKNDFPVSAAVVTIGNCPGADVDKFKKFKLTAVAVEKVKAPLIAECYAA